MYGIWAKPGRTFTYRAYEGGKAITVSFPNGRGASVVCHRYSYGGGKGLWELAVLDKEGNLDYSTIITRNVMGNLTKQQVAEVLDEIERLPHVV